jgi:hypothetical protein
MLSTLKKIDYLWDKYGFETLVVGSIVFILLYAFYNWLKGKNGTWSTKQYFDYTFGNNKEIVKATQPMYQQSSNNSFGESKGETECRRVLQHIFNRPFHKARPDFLRNEVTGNNFNLELDCFNEDLKLAVEYNGIQHYKYTPYFHKSYEHFLNQKYRDYMKRTMCKEAGITLIEVPYTVKIQDIYKFLRLELVKNGYRV